MSLEWTKFESLAGDARLNFEIMCRGIVRLHWGMFGEFFALKNQPGVEFHLKLNKDCPSLGSAGSWFGWQCKVFETTKSKDLTAASKKDIEDSLQKTVSHVPSLTDWVLWTTFTLSKGDQGWIDSLRANYSFTIHLWSEEELDNLLSGPAFPLRSTYFGELILTAADLLQIHGGSVSIVRDRWSPAHQKTDVERILLKALGEPDGWAELTSVGQQLKCSAEILQEAIDPANLDDKRQEFVKACGQYSDMLLQFHRVLADGDLDIINQWLIQRSNIIDKTIISFPRNLRSINSKLALEAANALIDMRRANVLLSEVHASLGTGLIAVLADAGGGKTQLAIEITAATQTRPAGVLMHGRWLHRGQNQNDFARNVVIGGNAVGTLDNLLASIDAAAKRARCRLPFVIDGLNESENPKDWKGILEYVQQVMPRYPNVLVVCTLRTGEHKRRLAHRTDAENRESFAVQALPIDIQKYECDGFGKDLIEAIRKYFSHYKIDCEESIEIPQEFLNHPLNLRIYCEVTNRKREKVVRINYFPATFSSLFDEYVKNVCDRIAAMTNLSYIASDIRTVLYQLGVALWGAGGREVEEASFRKVITDENRVWHQSVVNLLAQEGIIFRNPSSNPNEFLLTPIYDALGGHLIADSLLQNNIRDREFAWLDSQNVLENLHGEGGHLLGQDILRALVSLVPARMYGQQLWKVVPQAYRDETLIFSADLNPEHLDDDTVTALHELIENGAYAARIFARLWLTKSTPGHKLNARFVDAALSVMDVAERDLSWTEFLREKKSRYQGDGLSPAIEDLERKWMKTGIRSEADTLRALTLKWMLTTTDQKLRDDVTRALYWFGRGASEFMFDETIRALEINDPYVPERMFAASYGVAMALSVQTQRNTAFLSGALLRFASSIFKLMFADGAKHKTTHQFVRDYAARIIELAQHHNPDYFSDSDIARCSSPYPAANDGRWSEVYLEDAGFIYQISKASEAVFGKKMHRKISRLIPEKLLKPFVASRVSRRRSSPFHMDFENYTIGRLVPRRHNYDYDNLEYRKVRAKLLWRVFDLGWSQEKFATIEESIQRGQRHNRQSSEYKIDRYGKKYSWIAYHEMAGYLRDAGALGGDGDWNASFRTSEGGIDPSFCGAIEGVSLVTQSFLGDQVATSSEWVESEEFPDFSQYHHLKDIGKDEGPWLLLDAFVSQESNALKRQVFLFSRTFLLPIDTRDEILEFLGKQDLGGRWLPEMSDFQDTYFAEIPWSESFPPDMTTTLSFEIGTKREKIRQPKVLVRRNGNKLTFLQHEEEEVEIEVPIYKKYEVLMPVCGIPINAGGEKRQVSVLVKPMALMLNLIGQPQSLDMYTHSGELVTKFVSFGNSLHKESQKLLYIKESYLKKYLIDQKLSLVWATWGEKAHLVDWRHDHGSRDHPAYKVFSAINQLDPP